MGLKTIGFARPGCSEGPNLAAPPVPAGSKGYDAAAVKAKISQRPYHQ
jgi:hypothetical protein